MRRGSVLIVALWIIAVLSVMVFSFAIEAKQQAGVNVYVRERNRVSRLVEAGRILGEVVLSNYSEVPDYAEDEDIEALLEEDRWILEKRALKSDSKCVIGPILVDERDLESGTVTVEIELVNAGAENAINVNELYQGGDKNYRLRWELILLNYCGIPNDFEVSASDAHYDGELTVRLSDLLISSWNDWRDEDDTATAGEEGDECGAEVEWYRELYEDSKVDADDEDKKFPRNAAIPNINELGLVRGFRDFPAVLTGGVIDPGKGRGSEPITVRRGIVSLLGVSGTSKLNVNNCTIDQLLTIPGIGAEEGDLDDDDAASDAQELAQAILDTLKEQPERYETEEGRTWWPYKDWDDLTQRLDDHGCQVEIRNEASEYLVYGPDKDSVFKFKITGQSHGMSHSVNAEGYVRDGKVRYIKWREDN